jgi:hypothetical protein
MLVLPINLTFNVALLVYTLNDILFFFIYAYQNHLGSFDDLQKTKDVGLQISVLYI